MINKLIYRTEYHKKTKNEFNSKKEKKIQNEVALQPTFIVELLLYVGL